MTEHWTWWGRNLEFQSKFFWSSQKPLLYTVKGIPSAYQWKKCLKWLKNVTSCMMSWVLLENFRKVFTKTSTFARKHQWQCRERRFRNVQNFRLSATRWTVRAECMKRVIDNDESLLELWEECLKEKLDQETRQWFWVARAKWKFVFFPASIYHMSFTHDGSVTSVEKDASHQGKEICRFSDWHIEKHEKWWRLRFIFWGS